MRFGSNNPVFNKIKKEEVLQSSTYDVATYGGIARKTLFFLGMVAIGALVSILLFKAGNTDLLMPIIVVSAIGTFFFSLIALLIPSASKIFGTLYCLSQGVLVGLVSFFLAETTNGIVPAALVSVFAIFFVVATLYLTGVIKVTNGFMKFLSIFAIGFIVSMIILYIVMAVSNFQVNWGLMVLISAVSVFLATLYLFFDLENIRRIVEGESPKQLEWYAAFGLAYTLIWLYVELLRLISLFVDRK